MRVREALLTAVLASVSVAAATDRSWADPVAVLPGAPSIERTRPSLPGMGEPRQESLLITVGPRYGVGGNSPLGEEQKENFQLYDVAAVFRTPWTWRPVGTGNGLDLRAIASAGELSAAGRSCLMATLVPALALTTLDGQITVDIGTGPAFFSRHQFGVQDFGGPVQIIATLGLGLDLVAGFHAGYRFQHFSDAGIYGPTSLGVDMHIMDVSYRF